jgi:ELWxxDGT repeat protein
MARRSLAQLRFWLVGLLVLVMLPLASGLPTAQAVELVSKVKELGVDVAGQRITANILIAWNGYAYFERENEELWRTDGTEAGTTLLKTIEPNEPVGENENVSISQAAFIFKNQLFFAVIQPGGAAADFWKTDGTPAGTVKAFAAGGYAEGALVFGDYLFYTATTNAGNTVYRSDGTQAGTAPFVIPGQVIRNMSPVGDMLFINTSDANGNNPKLWRSDGTVAGTFTLLEGREARNFVAFNGAIYFRSGGLWKTDGTAAGTQEVTNIFADPDPAFVVGRIAVFNGKLYLGVTNGNFAGGESLGALWISDGTAAGTVKIYEDILILQFAEVGGNLFFEAFEAGFWRTDGTTAGTVIIAGEISTIPIILNNVLYYAYDSSSITNEFELYENLVLWRDDGTEAGTRPVTPDSIRINRPILLGDTILFTAYDSTGNTDLWKLVDDGNPYPIGRVTDGLQALYEFNEGSGSTVSDSSGVGSALNLKVKSPSAVRWRTGGLEVVGYTTIATPLRAKKLIDAAKASDQLTVEAWVTPAEVEQFSARILTISSNATVRNLTVAQGVFDQSDPSKASFRLRTSSTAGSGKDLRSPTGTLQNRLTHLVLTYDGSKMRIYVDGQQIAQTSVSGNLDSWNNGYPLVLAGERSGGRNWRGTYHLVAFYGRALTAAEVMQNYEAGAE